MIGERKKNSFLGSSVTTTVACLDEGTLFVVASPTGYTGSEANIYKRVNKTPSGNVAEYHRVQSGGVGRPGTLVLGGLITCFTRVRVVTLPQEQDEDDDFGE